MENETKLTMRIPTYNGEKYIEQTLENIFNVSLQNNFNKIETLVLDNFFKLMEVKKSVKN